MIGDKYIEFAKKNIIEYLKLILENNYNKEIVLPLIETYIKVRYYNYYEIKFKESEKNINYYMKKTVEQMPNDIKTKHTFYMFKYILYFDNVKKIENLKQLIDEINNYKTNILKNPNDNFITEITNKIKENEKRKIKFIESFKNDHFNIIENPTNHKKVDIIKLDYNIKFNKIYSAFSINKVYHTGIVNEQKAFITYYQTSLKILKNVINSIYNKEYIVLFPISILEKKQKTTRLKNVIENEMIKNNIILQLTYTEYIENKETINEMIKEGYNFAVEIDENYKYEETEKLWLDIFKYIVTDKEKRNFFDEKKVIVK